MRPPSFFWSPEKQGSDQKKTGLPSATRRKAKSTNLSNAIDMTYVP